MVTNRAKQLIQKKLVLDSNITLYNSSISEQRSIPISSTIIRQPERERVKGKLERVKKRSVEKKYWLEMD